MSGERYRPRMFLRRLAWLLVLVPLAAACGSSTASKGSVDDSVFHRAIAGTLNARSYRFSIETRSESGVTSTGTGRFQAPDRSLLEFEGVERITAGTAVYFRGGGFGPVWSKLSTEISGQLDYFALLVAVQRAAPVTRDGARYIFRTDAQGTTPAAQWTIWTDGARVSRFLQTSGRFQWDERFSDYDTAPAIEVPGESDVHPVTTVPTCPGGADPVFDGFCRKA